jgi:hypothetical protein
MKKKNRLYGLLAGLIIFLPSCVRTEEDLFDESAALRLNRIVNETKATLLAPEKGWIMDYFPNENSAGVIFLVKFDESGMAKMATINEYITKYTEAFGAWDIITDNGPVLTFNTYNDVFHIYSDPTVPGTSGDGDGKGLEGDYEFIIMNKTEDEVTLRGKKRGTVILLRRLAEDKEWEEYLTELKSWDNTLFKNAPNAIYLISGNDTIEASMGGSHVFSVMPKGADPIFDSEDLPFIITETGIRFQLPYLINEQNVQRFVLSEDRNRLICIDENVDAYFGAPNPTSFFVLDSLKNWRVNTDLPMSSKFTEAYNKLVDNCKTVLKEKFTDLYFRYYGSQSTFSLTFKSGKYTGNFYIEKIEENGNVKFAYKGRCDDTALYYLNNIGGFAELLDYIGQAYEVSPNIDCGLNFSTLEFKAKNNPEIRFFVSL